MFADHVSTAIIPTVVEANTIMIAACISTLHPVYELLCQKLRRQLPGEHGASPVHQPGSAVAPSHDAKRGFWSLLLEMDSWVESTIGSRLSRSRSQRGTVHTCEHDGATTIPTRTLEDAQNTQAPDEEPMREARGHQAFVKLYHAGLAPHAGPS